MARYLRRLAETEEKARLFAGIARKELNGESLSDQEYEKAAACATASGLSCALHVRSGAMSSKCIVSSKSTVLIWLCVVAASSLSGENHRRADEVRLRFTEDIMLSRQAELTGL